jgi:hypothetical protein
MTAQGFFKKYLKPFALIYLITYWNESYLRDCLNKEENNSSNSEVILFKFGQEIQGNKFVFHILKISPDQAEFNRPHKMKWKKFPVFFPVKVTDTNKLYSLYLQSVGDREMSRYLKGIKLLPESNKWLVKFEDAVKFADNVFSIEEINQFFIEEGVIEQYIPYKKVKMDDRCILIQFILAISDLLAAGLVHENLTWESARLIGSTKSPREITVNRRSENTYDEETYNCPVVKLAEPGYLNTIAGELETAGWVEKILSPMDSKAKRKDKPKQFVCDYLTHWREKEILKFPKDDWVLEALMSEVYSKYADCSHRSSSYAPNERYTGVSKSVVDAKYEEDDYSEDEEARILVQVEKIPKQVDDQVKGDSNFHNIIGILGLVFVIVGALYAIFTWKN